MWFRAWLPFPVYSCEKTLRRKTSKCCAGISCILQQLFFLVSFPHDSLRHVQSYNSGAIRNVVSAVIEMKKTNSYKPSLLCKTSTEMIRWIHLNFFMFLGSDLRISTSEFPVFKSTDHVVEKTNSSISQCKLRQLFSKSQLTKERNTYLIHFLLGTVFHVLEAQFSVFFA